MKSVFNFIAMIIFCVIIYFSYYFIYGGIDFSFIKIHSIDNIILKFILLLVLAYIGGVILLNIVFGAIFAGMFNVFINKAQRFTFALLLGAVTVVQWMRLSLKFYEKYHDEYQWYEEFAYVFLVYYIFMTVYQTARFQYNIEEAELLFNELKSKLERNEITIEQALVLLKSDKRFNQKQRHYIVELLKGNKLLTSTINIK